MYSISCALNTLRPRQNGRHFTDDTFKRIFLNQNVRNSINISLKFVPKDRIHNITLLVQIMAWCRPGDKPLSEPMTVRLLTHICVTRPQWVNNYFDKQVIRGAWRSYIVMWNETRTTRTPAFCGYPPPPHDYPYYWPVHFESQVHTIDQFISDPKSKQDESRKILESCYKLNTRHAL